MKPMLNLRAIKDRLVGRGSIPSRSSIPSLFTALEYTDPEQARQAKLTNTLLRVLLGLSMLVYLTMFISVAPGAIFVVATILLLVNLSSLVLLRRGYLRTSGLVLIVGLLLTFTLAAVFGEGVHNSPYIALIVVIILAGVVLEGSAGFVVAAISATIGLALVVAEGNNFLPTPILPYARTGYWFTLTIIFFAAAGLVYLLTENLRLALLNARQHQQAQADIEQRLEKSRQAMEVDATGRTGQLEQRAGYLQAIVDVTQSTAALLNPPQLMRTAAAMISEQFDLYYVGLFLVDLSGDWAVLQAGTGAAGEAMLARGHRIKVGAGMVGWSIANVQPRVAGDALQDAVRVVNPELPDTRSEAAIPLRSRGRVIGALSVQSARPQAFGELEIATFQALADLIAIALDNARLLSESSQALAEARSAQGQTTRRAWQDFMHGEMNLRGEMGLRGVGTLDVGYRYGVMETDPQLLAIARQAGGPQAEAQAESARRQAQATGRPVQISTQNSATLYMPIPVRELQIGVISFSKERGDRDHRGDKEHRGDRDHRADKTQADMRPLLWSEEEIELLTTIVGQMGVALDSARLYQDTQRLAYREQLTGEITARIRQTLDIQTVLRTAVEEIQRSLGLPEVMISLAASGDDLPGDDDPNRPDELYRPDVEHRPDADHQHDEQLQAEIASVREETA